MAIIRNTKKICTILLFTVLTACSSNTSVRQHADFVQNGQKDYTVAVLPADVQLYDNQNGPNDKERLDPEIEAKFYNHLKPFIEQALEDKGYLVDRVDFDDAMKEEPALAFMLYQIQSAAKQFAHQAYQTGQGSNHASNAKFSVGPAIHYLADIAGSDLLALPFYVQAKEGGNESAYNSIFLINAQTGDIMWTNHYSIETIYENTSSTNLKLADRAVDQVLQPLPIIEN